MSFKSIDLQTSMPRTVEMSPLAQQQQNKPMLEQTMLGQQAVKQAERDAQRNAETEKTGKSGIRDRQSRGQGGRSPSRESGKDGGGAADGEAPKSVHPHKGRHIDYIG